MPKLESVGISAGGTFSLSGTDYGIEVIELYTGEGDDYIDYYDNRFTPTLTASVDFRRNIDVKPGVLVPHDYTITNNGTEAVHMHYWEHSE